MDLLDYFRRLFDYDRWANREALTSLQAILAPPRRALKVLAPGGLLVTFSCSGGISAELFQKIIAGAAIDAEADAAIVGHLAASADHPIALNFPEGEYLKGLLIRKAAA